MPYDQFAGLIRVTGSYTRLLSDWLDLHGLEAPAIRAAVATYQANDEVPMLRWAQLLNDTLALRADDPAATVQLAQQVTLQHTGVLGYLAAACDTLGQALIQYQKFEQLFYGVAIGRVSSDGQHIRLEWDVTDGMGLIEEVAVMVLVALVRKELVADVSLLSVHLGQPLQGEHQHQLEQFFGCEVHGNSDTIRLLLPVTALSLPLQRGEPGLRQLLEQQASAMLRALPENDEFLRQLQAELVRELPEGDSGIQQLAARLHCSVRTLQRRLDDKGLSWKSLLERTREQLACQYLADNRLSLLEISMLLGYRNQGTFSRAFKRWQNCSPLAYRKANRPA